MGNQGAYAAESYTGMDNVHYLWFGHKEPRKDFIVRFGRSCLQTLSFFLVWPLFTCCPFAAAISLRVYYFTFYGLFTNSKQAPSYNSHSLSPLYTHFWSTHKKRGFERCFCRSFLDFYQIVQINICTAHAQQKAAKHCRFWYNCFSLIIGISACWMSSLTCDPFSAGAHQMMWRLSVFNRSWNHCCLPQSHHIALDKLVLWFLRDKYPFHLINPPHHRGIWHHEPNRSRTTDQRHHHC